MLSTKNKLRYFRVAVATGAMLAITAGFVSPRVFAQGPVTNDLPALSAVAVVVHNYPVPAVVTARPSYNVPQHYFIQEKTYRAAQAAAMIVPGISQRERAANVALGEYYTKLRTQQGAAMIAPGISQRERAANVALGEYYTKLRTQQGAELNQRAHDVHAALLEYYTTNPSAAGH